jgi:hypothetical protein
MMTFQELDQTTRRYMVEEFLVEQASPDPYCSKTVATLGGRVAPGLTVEALQHGTEVTLIEALSRVEYWKEAIEAERKGEIRMVRVNPQHVVCAGSGKAAPG